jgi:YidC/Oxa1 family membrane protein insertase
METQRLFLYLALAFLSLIIYQTWMAEYHAPQVPVAELRTEGQSAVAPALDAPGAPVAPSGSTVSAADPAVATVDSPRVSVRTDLVAYEIDALGATITRADLLEYGVDVDNLDDPFTLVSSEPNRFLVAESGLQAAGDSPAPTHRELFKPEAGEYQLGADQDVLNVPFHWDSGTGIKVTKTLTFTRGSYEVGVAYRVENTGDAPYTFNQYRQLKRKPATSDERQKFVHTYIGAVYSNPENVYEKYDFGDMEDENLDIDVTNGWVAMIQHYFATAWIPTADESNTAYTRFLPGENRYLVGMVSGAITVAPGAQGSMETKVFIGPKVQDILEQAAPNLRLTVDYGWLTILAQPLFWLLKTIHSFIGNWGWSIILVTFCIKAVFYKLSEASYKSMARMKALQPKLASLKERHGDDRAAMGQATMELYKKERVNPLGGCFPMLVQIPVFIALYWTLLESVELRHAPWMLWIQDLSIRDPFFILPVIMAATMYFQQKLNPAPVDPIQQKVFQFLPLIFGVFFAFFPAGLVLYWVVNNTLSIAQQYYITRHVIGDNPEPPKDNGKPGLMGRLAAMAEKANKNQGAAASAALPAASQAASDATEGASNDASDTTTDPAADQSADSGDSSAAGGTPVRKRKKKGKKGGKGGKR